MKPNQKKFKNIDEYISVFSRDIQITLQQIRETIHKAAPKAAEVISYNMPAFKQNGVLVYFAAFKNHIGFFPTSSGIKKFSKELSSYETSKGTIRFPLDKKIPLSLIRKIARYRLNEDLEKQRKKR